MSQSYFVPRVRARPGCRTHRRLANWLTCRRRLPILCRRQPRSFAPAPRGLRAGSPWCSSAPVFGFVGLERTRSAVAPAGRIGKGAGQAAAGPRPGGGWHWLSHGWHWLSQWHAGGGWHWLSQWHAGGGWHWLGPWSADGRGWLSQWHAGGRVGTLGRHNPNQRRTRVGAGSVYRWDEGLARGAVPVLRAAETRIARCWLTAERPYRWKTAASSLCKRRLRP